MNKEKDIDNQLYKYLSPDLYCYVHNYIVDLKRQITQLTNNWNELEEDLKKYDLEYLHETGEHQLAYVIESILDKMKEIKEGK